MRANVLLFAAGVWLLQQQAELPGAGTAWALAALGLTAFLPESRGRAGRAARRVVVAGACCAAGYAWAATLAGIRLADALPPEWEGRDVRIEGVVAALPDSSAQSVRFEFDVERVLSAGAAVPGRIVLSWWGAGARDGGPAARPELLPGERWQFTARLRRPRGLSNPHGFDYEAWLLEHNIRATGYVRQRPAPSRGAAMVHRPGYHVERARAALRERIQAALPDAPHAGVLVALAIGDQRAITPGEWQTFTRTGVNHLMSISGLHVTMVSGLVFALVSGLWRRSERLTLRLPAVRAGALAGVVTAFGYALLAGFAVPAQRTVYMLCVVAAAVWLGLAESATAVLAAALLAVLLLDPWAVLAPGFWLSFGAVGAIMYVCNGRLGRPHWLATWLRVQCAVTLAMIPVLLAVFQQVSVVSPVANAIAIPVVGLVVVPLTLAGMVLPVDWLLALAHLVLAWCMWVLEWLSGLGAAVWEQRAPPGWAVVAGTIAVLLLLAPRGFPGRALGAAGLAPLLVVAPAAIAPEALRVTVLDVGHGVAVLVRTAGHALLYDTGPPFGPRADSGSRVIVPYLRATGVPRLDALIVSHDDADHWGGAASVMQALPVEWLLSSLPESDPLWLQAERSARCRAGQSWEWDGVRFEILHPLPESYAERPVRDNDRSCVLMVSAPGARLLLPGDIEREAEAAFAARHGDRLRADVLLAPHQGSRSSSTPDFVRAVGPRLVVFPVGYRNRYGHPHRDVVQRYDAAGSRIRRTDRDGALTLAIGPEGGIEVWSHRAAYRRYWQTGLPGSPARGPEALLASPSRLGAERPHAPVSPPGPRRP